MFVAPIVEGHGEIEAVPALLHRIVKSLAPVAVLRVNRPIRVKANLFIQNEDYLRRHVQLAGAKAAQQQGLILILLDCEDDCTAVVGPTLLSRARLARPDVPVLVTLAYREYETWFLAGARSLRGHRGLGEDVAPPEVPESVRDAKGWLSQRMTNPYDPVVHQLEFTRALDLEQAQTNPSFRRLVRRIGERMRSPDTHG